MAQAGEENNDMPGCNFRFAPRIHVVPEIIKDESGL